MDIANQGLRLRLEKESEFSPTCMDYSNLLCYAQRKFGIDRDTARDRYGGYTYGQWKILLEVE
jgi:hypothetical protein